MSHILPYTCEQLGGVQINCILDDGEPWCKAIGVATALKYTDTDQAIRKHVADDDKRQQGSFNLKPVKTTGLKGNWKMTKYINESGLFCSIFGKDREEANSIKHWVTNVAAP